MALTTLSVTSTTLDGSLSNQDLESRFDAALAGLLTNNIVSVHINADDKARRQGKQLDIQVGYDDAAGAAVLTDPYQLRTFIGRTLDEALTSAAAFRAANPAWFYAAPWHEHVVAFATANKPFVVFQFYSQDGVNGPANWHAGGITTGTLLPVSWITYVPLATPPTFPVDGMVALSDGTAGGFDGTNGAGLYRYDGINWIYIEQYNAVTSTVTAAGTLTLTTASAYVHILTGVTTHTVQLPAANALGAGFSVRYKIKNRSTGDVTVQRAGADTIEGAASIVLASGDGVELVSDGVSEWEIF